VESREGASIGSKGLERCDLLVGGKDRGAFLGVGRDDQAGCWELSGGRHVVCVDWTLGIEELEELKNFVRWKLV